MPKPSFVPPANAEERRIYGSSSKTEPRPVPNSQTFALPPLPNSLPATPYQLPDSFDTRNKPRSHSQTTIPRKRLPNQDQLHSSNLTAPQHPYGLNHSSSQASLSASNILDTKSNASGSVSGSVYTDDDFYTGTSQGSYETETGFSQKRLNKHKFANLLSRTKSIRLEEHSNARQRPRIEAPRVIPVSRERNMQNNNLRTAPIEHQYQDRAFRDMAGSAARNRSADRATVESDDDLHVYPKPNSASGQGSKVLSNIVHSSTKAADGIGRAGNRFWGKFARSGSSHEREPPPPENYVFRVINLPLVEQTRRTRLKKQMDLARDKTEFWMPSLPYRCIDYLNSRGVEVEGLYRIPGSSKEIKQWQMKFDMGPDHDVDLLADDIELYDINVVGSILKAWLRELPDDLLPKSIQTKISTECAGAKETPQLMRDELSKLPPFNYYLLFAITCHISLLHSHSDKNKMNYHNLCICFQPCMKVDAFCFQFLVCDWRNCWQGCYTEKEYLDIENIAMEEATLPSAPAPIIGRSLGDSSSTRLKERSPSRSSSRPNTAPRNPSGSNDRYAPAPPPSRSREYHTSSMENTETHTTSQPSRTRDRRPSTPPTLGTGPVTQVSPMRI